MMSFDFSLPELTFNEINFTKTMNRVIGEVIRESARQWMRAILAHIPVETGMARATMIPLGEYLNNVGGLAFGPKRQPYYSKLEQGIQDMGFGIEKTSFTLIDDAPDFRYYFEWSTNVKHYWISEFYKGNYKPGELALLEGEEAFFAHFNTTIIRRLPKLEDFLDD